MLFTWKKVYVIARGFGQTSRCVHLMPDVYRHLSGLFCDYPNNYRKEKKGNYKNGLQESRS